MSAALELVVIEHACACCGGLVADQQQLICVDGDCICGRCHGEPVPFIGPADNCAECGDLFDADVLAELEGVARRGRFCPGCWDELQDEHDTRELEVDCRETCGGPRYGI